MPLILAEELVLLLLDDVGGRPLTDRTRLEAAIGGALLVELALTGRVDPAGRGDVVRKGHLVVRDPSPTEDEIVDTALRHIGSTPRPPARLVPVIGKQARPAIVNRLVAHGILRADHRKILGLFPTTSWPAVTTDQADAIHRRVQSALLESGLPDPRTAGLIALLQAIGVVSKVVDGDRRLITRRAKELSTGDWASEGVRKAVQAAGDAVAVAVADGGGDGGGGGT